MKMNIKNILVIAQKEFADIIWSPRFIVILAVLMVAVLASGYQAGQSMARMAEQSGFVGMGITLNPLMIGFQSFTYLFGSTGALVAIVLGFDAIVRERKSGSLNVLMTHPVYRDNVITGKLVGMMAALGVVIVVAVAVPVGIMLSISGISVNPEELSRIIVYVALAFLLLSIYLALGIATSTFCKEPSNSLVYSLAVWVVLGTLLMQIAFILAGIITGQSIYSMQGPEDSENFFAVAHQISQLSPLTHFQDLISGSSSGMVVSMDVSSGSTSTVMRGLFDMNHTLGYWMQQYWVNLMVLIVTPVILLVVSFISFMRQDITL
ncbi:MAG: ABC transporter permease [Methanosarcinales archaeon]|nr:ABC transporter permease [Methanosarcinales archaeon]